MKNILRTLIREPLLHFLLLGALIFVAARYARSPVSGSGEKIVVTRSQIESLAIGFSRTWMRPPTKIEMQGLVDDYIREEVLYREAKAMGLDQDDLIVRRRMRQKLEFLTEDLAAKSGPPTEAELESYLRHHPDNYQEDASCTFEHVFFNRDRNGVSAEAEANATLVRLNGKDGGAMNVEMLGDPFLLPLRFENVSAGETARLFGDSFEKQLETTEPGHWSGPLRSSYGLHLVRITERRPAALVSLAKVREAVRNDLLNERRKQELDVQFAKLRAHYTVVVEAPEAPKVAEVR